VWLLAVAGCAPVSLGTRRPPTSPATDTAGVTTGETTGETAGTAETGLPAPCPPDMVWSADVCVDRYEASLEGHSPYEVATVAAAARNGAGEVPQGYVSADVAAASCALAGKRLCTSEEWLAVCRGDDQRVYPYGDTYDPAACNDTRAQHPVIEVFGPGANSLAASGDFPDCVTPDGVFDLHGNLHEWVDDPEGTFRGGFYVDAVINGPGCTYATTAHVASYHDYSTGFRCCADPG
jgi:formylglycine-generating enzyme